MKLKECFEQFGGDYAGAVSRLGKEERLVKYSKMFSVGKDYQLIEESLLAGDLEDAFRNVHNLKGVALNLGLTPLHKTADILCEAIRPGSPPVDEEELKKMLEDVKISYDNIILSLAGLE